MIDYAPLCANAPDGFGPLKQLTFDLPLGNRQRPTIGVATHRHHSPTLALAVAVLLEPSVAPETKGPEVAKCVGPAIPAGYDVVSGHTSVRTAWGGASCLVAFDTGSPKSFPGRSLVEWITSHLDLLAKLRHDAESAFFEEGGELNPDNALQRRESCAKLSKMETRKYDPNTIIFFTNGMISLNPPDFQYLASKYTFMNEHHITISEHLLLVFLFLGNSEQGEA